MSDPLNYTKSRWNGWNGNECVYKKEYHKAIDYYSTAIELYPLEYRYFVNRSFCFDQLQRFELALEDANRALLLQSDWGKCYFRKGRALKGLNRLSEAELSFLKVIQLEGNDCKEAQNELTSLRQTLSSHPLSTNTSNDMNSTVDQIKNDFKEEKEEKEKEEEEEECHTIKKCNKNQSKNSSKRNSTESENSLSTKPKVNVVLNKSIGSDSDSQNKRLIISDCNGEKNLLKELSEFLLNRNVLLSNENLKSVSNKSTDKTFAKNEEKSASDNNNNRSKKTIEREPKIYNELKTKTNRRNNTRKGMDEIVEIWDDSRNHWSPTSNRTQSIGSSKSFRKTEPTNLWNFKGLYVSNIKANESTKQILHDILSEFGKVTHIELMVEREAAIANFDNPESPRIAMSRLQGVHMPNICEHNQKLRLMFRPLNNSKNYPSINCVTDRQLNNECYFWRTTGCGYIKYCKLKHIPANRGVDLQPWMQTIKPKFKRQNRNRFEVI